MRRGWGVVWKGLCCGVIWAAAAGGATTAPDAAAAASTPVTKRSSDPPARVDSVTLRITHRVFVNFVEVRKIALRESFQVGDSPFSARVVRYVPDFAMHLETRKIVSRSNEPRNPAFEIIVHEKGAPQDTTWAFLDMPPHFARNSMLAFQVRRIDFVGRASIVSADSSAARGRRP